MDNYQYPSVALSRRYTGNRDLSESYRGEANKLLYQLKNLMQFRQLGQLKMTRLFTDGTVITAWSIFGQDFVNIDVSRTIPISVIEPVVPWTPGECTITFINLPSYVQPMRYPGYIVAGEIEGIDYHKTYYTIDASNCPTCQDIVWEFLFRYLQSSPLVPLPEPPLPISTRIEWPIESLHRHDYDANGLLLDHDGTDHTIYSAYPPAWGEIIKHGVDDGGTYIVWKAYTEDRSGTISRTGLGIMRLVARIKDDQDLEKCAQNARIEVDCCIKDDALRPVEIWWEDFGTCQPYIPYPGVVYNAICKMPEEVPLVGLSGLGWYGCTHPHQPLYAIPEIKGSCLPMEWTLTGPIELWNSDKNDNIVFFRCLEGGCNDEATITLRDRCGSEYVVIGTPCCANAATLSINYTSLVMACSQQQTFAAIGGCGPYTWSLSGGGSLNTTNGVEVIYTAPATNANCTSNPTITLTDCCGQSAEIKLAVNCYTGGYALKIGDAIQYPDTCPPPNPWDLCNCWDDWNDMCRWLGSYYCHTYNCNGTLVIDLHGGINLGLNFDPNCATPAYTQSVCNTQCALGPHGRCANNTICGLVGWGLNDLRTADMKTQGCCPLNPLTGLPY